MSLPPISAYAFRPKPVRDEDGEIVEQEIPIFASPDYLLFDENVRFLLLLVLMLDVASFVYVLVSTVLVMTPNSIYQYWLLLMLGHPLLWLHYVCVALRVSNSEFYVSLFGVAFLQILSDLASLVWRLERLFTTGHLTAVLGGATTFSAAIAWSQAAVVFVLFLSVLAAIIVAGNVHRAYVKHYIQMDVTLRKLMGEDASFYKSPRQLQSAQHSLYSLLYLQPIVAAVIIATTLVFLRDTTALTVGGLSAAGFFVFFVSLVLGVLGAAALVFLTYNPTESVRLDRVLFVLGAIVVAAFAVVMLAVVLVNVGTLSFEQTMLLVQLGPMTQWVLVLALASTVEYRPLAWFIHVYLVLVAVAMVANVVSHFPAFWIDGQNLVTLVVRIVVAVASTVNLLTQLFLVFLASEVRRLVPAYHAIVREIMLRHVPQARRQKVLAQSGVRQATKAAQAEAATRDYLLPAGAKNTTLHLSPASGEDVPSYVKQVRRRLPRQPPQHQAREPMPAPPLPAASTAEEESWHLIDDNASMVYDERLAASEAQQKQQLFKTQ